MNELKTKDIEIENFKFKIKEVSFLDEIDLVSGNFTSKESFMKTLNLCVVEPKMSDEFLKTLPGRVGNKLFDEIKKLNGWDKGDFLKTQRN